MDTTVIEIVTDLHSETVIEYYSDSDSETQDVKSNNLWPEGNFQPKEWIFTRNSGIHEEINLDGDKAIDYFKHFYDDVGLCVVDCFELYHRKLS